MPRATRTLLLLLSLLTSDLGSLVGKRGASKASLTGVEARTLGRPRGSETGGSSPEASLPRALAAAEGWPALPWQQPADWVPPYSPYVNDLQGLIRSQRRPGVSWLTVFALTRLREDSYKGKIFLNTLTSYVLLGGGQSYVVVVANEEALRTCLRLRLPCYNATVALHPRFTSSYTFGTWAKVLMTRLVLKALPPDLNLHLSDHDVIYLKKIIPTIDRFTAGLEYDMLGQYEDNPRKGINTGVVFARNTPKIHAMYDEWIRYVSPEIHDQDTFHKLIGNITVVHEGEGDGSGDRGRGGRNTSVALVVRHNVPWTDSYWCHWCHSEYEDCWEGDNPRHCELPYRLYIHAICVADKILYIKGLGLWFLDHADPRVIDYAAIAAAGLPCAPPNDVADLKIVT